MRGVDPVKKEIYIVTSVDSSSLRRANRFIKGPVTVPDIVLFFSGLVCGVDPVKKEIYIVTSVDSSSLRHVNTFIKGPVTVPYIVFILFRACAWG